MYVTGMWIAERSREMVHDVCMSLPLCNLSQNTEPESWALALLPGSTGKQMTGVCGRLITPGWIF